VANEGQLYRASESRGAGLLSKIPVPTRWGSVLRCLVRLLKSKNILERLVSNDETNLSRRLRSSVLDDDMFWIYVQKHRELIHPIVKLIFLLESEKAKVSRVPQCFRELNDHFTSAYQEDFRQKRSTKLSSVFLLFLLFLDTLYFYLHLFIFLRVHQERSAIVICTITCYGFVVTCFLIGKQMVLKNSLEYSRGYSRGKLFLRILHHYL